MDSKLKIAIIAGLFILVIAVVSANMERNTADECAEEIIFAHQDRVAGIIATIAFEKGFFEEEGLNMKQMRFTSGPACAEALLYADADFGTMGDTTAISSVAQGHPVTIIASHGSGENRHRIMVSDESGIESIADLEGKRIAVKYGTSTHGGMLLFASANGLDLSDELIDLRPSEQLTALATGSVDAMVASEPTPSQAEADGYGHELATLGGLNNTYPILILVSNDFAENNPDKVVSVLRALEKATEYVQENPEEAAVIQGEINGIDAEIIENAMLRHDYELDMSERTVESLISTSEFLVSIGNINTVPDFNNVTDPSYLEKASNAA